MNTTVCLVAVTMATDSQKLTEFWWAEHTLLVGYDPAWLTPQLTTRIIRERHGADVTIQEGVLV
jgi:hypothetical protein